MLVKCFQQQDLELDLQLVMKNISKQLKELKLIIFFVLIQFFKLQQQNVLIKQLIEYILMIQEIYMKNKHKCY